MVVYESNDLLCHFISESHGALHFPDHIVEIQRQNAFAEPVLRKGKTEASCMRILNRDHSIGVCFLHHILHTGRIIVLHHILKRVKDGFHKHSLHSHPPLSYSACFTQRTAE